MSGDSFFVIACTADGLMFDGPISREELEQRLTDGDYGHKRFANKNPGTDGFAIRLKDDELLIISGTIVQPKPVDVVKRWSLK